MSSFSFSSAKNGEETCSIDGKFFHSAYNPSREAETFVNSLNATIHPSVVTIIEPGLSYVLPFLRNRFPDAKLACISLENDFDTKRSGWDFIIPFDADETVFSEGIFSALGEELLCASLCFSLPMAEQLLAGKTMHAWMAVKKAVLKARDVLYTRSYFGRRWVKNAVRFATCIEHPCMLEFQSKPIIVAASGPSLKTSLPFLKKWRTSYFLLAVSSALSPLTRAGITPDIVLTTDGGFWAKKHIHFPGLSDKNLVFAATCEASLPSELLMNVSIIPLAYENSIGKKLFDAISLPYGIAFRNGTVSGTACLLALSITDKNVYLCGMDLEESCGFQHTQPNQLDIANSSKTKRITNDETRMAASQLNCASLAVYRSWFQSESFHLKNRVFRLSDSWHFNHTLGQIRDISWEEFEKQERKLSACDGNATQKSRAKAAPFKKTIEERKKIISDLIHKEIRSEKWEKELFIAEKILLERSISEEDKELYQKQLEEKRRKFVEEIGSLI